MSSLSHIRFSSRETIISHSGEKTSGSGSGSNGEHPPNNTEATIPRRNKYYSCNDEGRAHRFIDFFGEFVRFVPEQGIWLVWNETRWMIDTDGAMERLAMQMCKLMGIAAFDIKGKEGRSSAIREAEKCGDYAVISNYLKLARKIESVILPNYCLIPKPWIIAAKNGIMDLRTGETRDYSRDDFVMHTLGCEVDANAACPRFKQFMREVLPDYHVRRFVQKAVGYSLTGIGSEHIFSFLYGDGRNGKSTFVRVLKRLFGRYALVAGPKLFYSVEYHPTPDDQVAELFGKRIAFASESRERARLNEDFMKHVTGGEEIRGCWKYKHGFEFQPQVVPWISGNHKPKISGTDEGIWSRVRLIPFENRFVGKNRILNLDLQLFEELPGILNWAIEGALLWQKEGLEMPRKIRQAVAEYRTEEDTLAEFISEHMVVGGIGVLHSSVFEAYKGWAAKAGICFTVTRIRLGMILKERGWKARRTNKGVFWPGITLTSSKVTKVTK